MNAHILQATVVTATIAGLATWVAMKARTSWLKSVARYFLLAVSIASTTLLLASVAFYVVLTRESADSPAAFIPLVLAAVCCGVAIFFWAGFALQAFYKPRERSTGGTR